MQETLEGMMGMAAIIFELSKIPYVLQFSEAKVGVLLITIAGTSTWLVINGNKSFYFVCTSWLQSSV